MDFVIQSFLLDEIELFTQEILIFRFWVINARTFSEI